MIGNDIVDRAQAKRDSNWKRRGFLDKLFTPSEQQLIQAASNPECVVWTLWSMKESAYKATTRRTGKRVFNPAKISCTLKMWSEEAADGCVVYEEVYQTHSLITPDYITSIAFPDSLPSVPKQLVVPLDGTDYESQSSQLRASVLEYCSAVSLVSGVGLQIDRDANNFPVLVITNSSREAVSIPVSLSHHGQYGAYCIAPAIETL